jgi:hypothetical protein
MGDDVAKDGFWADIEKKLSVFRTSRDWEAPNEVLLTTGRR